MNEQEAKHLKEHFDREGYVFIPGFLRSDEVLAITDQLQNYIREKVPKMPPNHVFYEDKNDPSTLKQLQDMHVHDPFFSEKLNVGKFYEIARLLLNDKVIGQNIEYFNKPPRIGKPTPPHQDNYYFMLHPPKAITMWLGLENVDEENGCVRYIPGSHLRGMRPHGRTQTLGFSQGILDYGEKETATDEVFFSTKPGDLLIHHSMTIHRADGNKSQDRSRKALGLIYFGESAREDTEAKKAYQKILGEERLANQGVK